MRKFLSVLLAMAMVLSLTVTSFAVEDTAATRARSHDRRSRRWRARLSFCIRMTCTVRSQGYAYIAQLKADYEAKGAEVILVDAGDFSQGDDLCQLHQGR